MLSQPVEKKENALKRLNLNPEIPRFFLAVLAAVVLIALGFFVYKTYLSPKFGNGDLSFLPSYKDLQLRTGDSQNLSRLIASASATSDSKEKGEKLASVFLTVSSDYSSSPSEDKRKFLFDLHKFLTENFPEVIEKYQLEVPCKAEACGAFFNFSAELAKIKDDVNNNKQLNSQEKASVADNLNNAALENSSSKFNSLLAAFTNLKTFAFSYQSEEIRELAQRVGQLMKSENEEAYGSLEKRGVLKLE